MLLLVVVGGADDDNDSDWSDANDDESEDGDDGDDDDDDDDDEYGFPFYYAVHCSNSMLIMLTPTSSPPASEFKSLSNAAFDRTDIPPTDARVHIATPHPFLANGSVVMPTPCKGT